MSGDREAFIPLRGGRVPINMSNVLVLWTDGTHQCATVIDGRAARQVLELLMRVRKQLEAKCAEMGLEAKPGPIQVTIQESA